MIKFTVITITYNAEAVLERTLQSVLCQTHEDVEHLIIDGASTDGTLAMAERYKAESDASELGHKVIIRSEPDDGIYNAMNKGIRMAKGEYVVMINSGDWLMASDVLERMAEEIERNGHPAILYGTTTNVWPDGRQMRNPPQELRYTMFSFYRGTLDHVGTLIQRKLFDEYGYYDESMRIVSDWSWFLKVVALEGIQPVHVDIDTIYFDMTGISESEGKNRATILKERRSVLKATLPPLVLADYDRYVDDIVMMRRLHRHPWAFSIVRFLERILFKIEKWSLRNSR